MKPRTWNAIINNHISQTIVEAVLTPILTEL